MSKEILSQITQAPMDGLQIGQTLDLSNIVRILKADLYSPPTELAPHGWFMCPDGTNRHIIGHDTSLDGGVYMEYGLNQNIVTDMSTDQVLKTCYNDAKSMLVQDAQESHKVTVEVLSSLMDKVQKYLPYDEQRVTNFNRENTHQARNDTKALGDYIYMDAQNGRVMGAGICLHQALLFGVLLEHACMEGITGDLKVAVYRNHDSIEGSGHAWVTVKDGNESSYIVDVANSFIGPVNGNDSPWRYGLSQVSLRVS